MFICGAASGCPVAEQVWQGGVSNPYPDYKIDGKASFASFSVLVKRFVVFVTSDSGPMHVARNLGVPTAPYPGNTPK